MTPILRITPNNPNLVLSKFSNELIVSPKYITFKSTTKDGEAISLQIPSELKSESDSEIGELFVDDEGFVKLKR